MKKIFNFQDKYFVLKIKTHEFKFLSVYFISRRVAYCVMYI